MVDQVSFAEFFRELHGYAPYPWQEQLADRLRNNTALDEIAVPASLGKTVVIDAWVWALAHNPTVVQRRLVFTVNRRVVVDSAWLRARDIAEKLESAGEGSVLRKVADQLRALTSGNGIPLLVARMRGGAALDDTWVRRPDQPTVISSTTHQAGSRLLFRGYGVSPKVRSMHAGLLGIDSLWVVDEAHLVDPFVETLRAVIACQTAAPRSGLVRPMRLLPMTATPTSDNAGSAVLRLSDQDRAVPDIDRRLHIPRRLVMHAVDKSKSNAVKKIGGLTVASAKNGTAVIGVVVNRVSTARAVYNYLTRGKNPLIPPDRVVLFTGRQRPSDRRRLLNEWMPRIAAERLVGTPADGPWVVISTQVIEVGADISFDHLVIELPDLPSLWQRLGRLNRLGYLDSASADIVAVSSDQKSIYGDAVTATWNWLSQHAVTGIEQPAAEFTLDTQTRLMASGWPTGTVRETPQRRLFTGHDVWTLAQTCPAPVHDLDIEPFIVGVGERSSPDVTICWRTWLPGIENREQWHDLCDDWQNGPEEDEALQVFEYLRGPGRPFAHELLPVPIGEARRWLNGTTVEEGSDVEGVAEEGKEGAEPRPVLVVRGSEPAVVTSADIEPGDIIMLPCSYGGADRHGCWDPSSTDPVTSVEDADPDDPDIYGWVRFHVDGTFVDQDRDEDRDEDHPWTEDETFTAAVSLADPSVQDRFGATEQSSRRVHRFLINGRPFVVAVGKTPRTVGGINTDDDDTLSFCSGPVLLEDHLRAVADTVTAIAQNLGIPQQEQVVLGCSGGDHDTGKRGVLMQQTLHAGDITAIDPRNPLAKSSARNQNPRRASHKYRHEAISVLINDPPSGIPQDLLPLWRHLVGSHHGYGRPHFPSLPDELLKTELVDGTVVHNELQDGICTDWVDQFASLNETYGPWLLGFFEAIVRAGDWDASSRGT